MTSPTSSKIRICKDCVAERPFEEFKQRALRPAPHPGPRCVTHHRAKKKMDSQRAAEARWLNNYGITAEQYLTILAAQDGGCGFCGRPPRTRRLAVDHNHACCPGKTSCGKCVRGLLCWTCNKFSEHIADNPIIVARMARYYYAPPAQLVKKAAT